MSDFTSNFWSVYVAAITLGGIIACILLLWFSGKAKAMTAHDNTTGHVWDGDLREMNNPLPRWWVWLFVLTVIFALAYLAMYPGLGSFAGKLGWSSTGQHEVEVAKGNKEVEPIYAKFNGMKPEDLARDPQAMAIGDRLFLNNCAQCHGSDARGSKGFPNLTDNDWLHGGSTEKIKETLVKGRIGNMPPMAAAVGTPDDVRNVAHYVLSLSGSPHDSLKASLGKAKFGACAACHGADGKGNQALGAPNLTDDVWLHGWGENAIVAMVNNGKVNQMPAQEGKLTDSQIHVLTAYVWSLSNKGGVTAPVAAASAAAAGAVGADSASVAVENGVVKFYFASGKSDLAGGAEQALGDIVAGVKSGKKAVVSGYVDSTGNAAQNADLAKQRAFAVRDQLKALGVAEEKIELQKPADIKAGAGAEARRVEVSLM